jgi:ferredoxin
MPACDVCKEVITQPLCAVCLERQIASWLQERVPALPEVVLELEDLGLDLGFSHGLTTCIKCNRCMSVCSFCYIEHVKSWLETRFPELLNEYEMLFGFELKQAKHFAVEQAIPMEGLL